MKTFENPPTIVDSTKKQRGKEETISLINGLEGEVSELKERQREGYKGQER